jgi:hypothetical protein
MRRLFHRAGEAFGGEVCFAHRPSSLMDRVESIAGLVIHESLTVDLDVSGFTELTGEDVESEGQHSAASVFGELSAAKSFTLTAPPEIFWIFVIMGMP